MISVQVTRDNSARPRVILKLRTGISKGHLLVSTTSCWFAHLVLRYTSRSVKIYHFKACACTKNLLATLQGWGELKTGMPKSGLFRVSEECALRSPHRISDFRYRVAVYDSVTQKLSWPWPACLKETFFCLMPSQWNEIKIISYLAQEDHSYGRGHQT